MTAAEARQRSLKSQETSDNTQILRDSLISTLDTEILLRANGGLTSFTHVSSIHPSHAKDYFIDKGYSYVYGHLMNNLYYIKLAW